MPLNLTPDGTTFSDEKLDRYWPTPILQNLSTAADSVEDNHATFFKMVKKYAPHLRESFVCDPAWWSRNWGTPESHVRFPIQVSASVTSFC
jgi:hypothetical protein